MELHIIFTCLVVACLQILRVGAMNLNIIPDHVRVREGPSIVSFTCAADLALVGCQFRWMDNRRNAGPPLDLSRGPDSQADPAHLNDELTGYSYIGRGLEAGVCGVTLEVEGRKIWLVACRVRAETGGWQYAWADLYTKYHAPIPHRLTPREAVVLPGGEARFMWKVQEPLSYCIFHLPSMSGPLRLDFNQGAASRNSTGRHRYLGAGLQSGECGLALTNIREGDNGPVGGYIQSRIVKDDGRFIALIVARPPTAPTLSVTYTGTNLTATCEVGYSRPVANLTWFLGDAVLRQDENDDSRASPYDSWRWPWMEGSIQQTIKIQLKPEDHGKVFKCVVSHVSLDQPLEAKKLISFLATSECPPLTSQSVLISCSLAGEAVNCNQPLQFATEAKLACKPGFSLPVGFVNYRKVICQRNGNWSHQVFTCFPDCGRRISNDIKALVANGTDVTQGEFPWHVGIYSMSGDGSMEQKCGGTIITPSVIVTAAHCFWRKSNRNPNARNFKVAAGKLLWAWDDPEPGVQKRNVSEIKVHELFRGGDGNYGSDIAIVLLESQFDINPRVNLVCVDWDNSLERRQLTSGSVGVVAGWGLTQDGVHPDTLTYVELPFVPSVTCLDSLPGLQQSLVTTEKICAGFVNRSTSVCPGDSGGGLVFLDPGSNKYYLRGIVSINFAPWKKSHLGICFSQHYTAFTKLSSYITWLHDNNIEQGN